MAVNQHPHFLAPPAHLVPLPVLHRLSSSWLYIPAPSFSVHPTLLFVPPPPPPPPLPPWLWVPVCLYVTSVKLSGGQAKVNSPAPGSGVMGGRDVFPQEPRDPLRLLAGAREGLQGKMIPKVAPHKNTHCPVHLFTSLDLLFHVSFPSSRIIVVFCFSCPSASVCLCVL